MLDRVIEIVSEHLNINIEDILEDSRIIEDLGADSLDAVELIMIIEENFGIEIASDEVENMATIADIVNYLEDIEEQ